jgi:adenosylcobinamide-GDP ribazoletransferase
MNYFFALYAAMQFLTRIPLNITFINNKITEKILAKSLIFFPFIGMLMGLVLWSIFVTGNYFFNQWITAALILLVQLLLTGGLHIDGFIDTCDAFFSNKPMQKMLEIMKDSRVGALGVASAITLMLLKFSLLAQVPLKAVLVIPVVMLVLSRWSLVTAIVFFPYAKETGLGKLFQGEQGWKYFFFASILTFSIIASFQMPYLYLVWLIVFIYTIMIGKRISFVLGGLTGDIYGWFSETNELICLMLLILYFV